MYSMAKKTYYYQVMLGDNLCAVKTFNTRAKADIFCADNYDDYLSDYGKELWVKKVKVTLI